MYADGDRDVFPRPTFYSNWVEALLYIVLLLLYPTSLLLTYSTSTHLVIELHVKIEDAWKFVQWRGVLLARQSPAIIFPTLINSNVGWGSGMWLRTKVIRRHEPVKRRKIAYKGKIAASNRKMIRG